MRSLRTRSLHPRRVERLVLLLGFASSLAMLLAARQIELRPAWLGEFALDEAARKISAGVTEEWRQLVRDPDRWIDLGTDPLRWSTSGGTLSLGASRAEGALAERMDSQVDALAGQSFAAFDALLDQALQREVGAGDLEGALSTVEAALQQPCDAGRRSRARLRAIQLARKLEREPAARVHWLALREEATGREAEDGVSCLLLGALAISPVLTPESRARVRDELMSLWIAGGLTLPAGVVEGRDDEGRLTIAAPAEIALLAEELAALSPLDKSVGDERLLKALEAERSRALEVLLGELPTDPIDGSLGIRFLDGDVLVYRARSTGELEGTFLRVDELIDDLGTHLRSLPFFPGGFHVDLRGDREELGVAISSPSPLWKDALGNDALSFMLRHEDPAAFMIGEERRLGILQVGLLAMAAFTLLAGIVSFQGLRRQRALHELKSRFVANVSHELRTPVTGILLATENLSAGRARTPERLERYHGLIRREAERLRRLVEDVLDFSRLERGVSTHLRLERIALDSFVNDLVHECKSRVEEAKLTFEADVRLDAVEADLDAEALRRAVSNLTDNAVRHSGSETIALSVAAGEQLVIAIEDSGSGIPASQRETIFEPFHQVAMGNGSTEGVSRGTGLGLAIVHEIMRGHGGAARCLPLAKGSGTRFELTLPLRFTAIEGESTP